MGKDQPPETTRPITSPGVDLVLREGAHDYRIRHVAAYVFGEWRPAVVDRTHRPTPDRHR